MRRSGAADRDHRIATRVTAFLDDVHARGRGHVLADDLVDAPGRLDRRQTEPPAEPADRCRCRSTVERHASAEKEIGVEIAEQQVGVGYSRFGPAKVVTRWTRIGTRAARADLHQTQLVDTGDRAAAGADLDHVDYGRPD